MTKPPFDRAMHFPFLDQVRGVAILGVFLYHCLWPAFSFDQLPWRGLTRDFLRSPAFLAVYPLSFGWAGVALFFVVSGFCVHLSYARARDAPGSWVGFLVRRFFRIYPPYLTALVIFAFAFPGTRLGLGSAFDWAQLGSHLALLHSLDDRFYFGIVPAFWSIAVEAHLYLIYPLLLALANRVGWKASLAVTGGFELLLRAASSLLGLAGDSDLPRWLSGSPFYYWYSWAIGAWIAEAHVRGQKLPFASSSAALWLLLAVLSSIIRPLVDFTFPLFCLFTATVISKQLSLPAPAALPTGFLRKHVQELGTWSFSFYLLHQPIIGLVPIVLKKVHLAQPTPLLMFGLCAATYPIVLIASRMLYRYCELPSIALGKSILGSVRAT